MNDRDEVKLRDYVDLCIDHVEEALVLRAAAEAEARTLAAAELSRRLDILNHSHTQLIEMQAKFLPREVFELANAELNKRLLSLEKIVWGFGAVVGFLAVVMPLLVRFLP